MNTQNEASNLPPFTEQEFLNLTQISETPILSEAEFRDRIKLEVPTYIPEREDRLTDKDIQDLLRDPILRPEVIKKKEQEKLDNLSNEENKRINDQNNTRDFFNLSLQTILDRLSNTFIDIINDLLSPPENISFFNYLIDVLSKNDRLIYIGIMIISISIFLSFIQTDL